MSIETDPQVVANNQRIAKAESVNSVRPEDFIYANRKRLCAEYAELSCIVAETSERHDEYYRAASAMGTATIAAKCALLHSETGTLF